MQRLEAWREASSRLVALKSDGSAPSGREKVLTSLVHDLIEAFPAQDLPDHEMHQFLREVTHISLWTPLSVPHLAQLCFSILQHTTPAQDVVDQLFEFFSSWLSSADPATELLYTLALLKPSHHVPKAVCEMVAAMSVELTVPLEVRRAALHYLRSLCDQRCEAGSEGVWPLQTLTSQLLRAAQMHSDTASSAKLVLSQLRVIHPLVKTASKASLLPLLSDLLAGLRFFMTTGLPGQFPAVTPLPPALFPVEAGTKKRGPSRASAATAPPPVQHSRLQTPPTARPPSTPSSTSESDISDNELQDLRISKTLAGKLRHEALLSLSSIFSVLDPRNTFSYCQSFLPDGPRLPTSPPSLLSCALRDPNHKCRSAALAVVSAILDRSKPFLAAADDKVCVGMAFTPFSSHLGAMLRELHHRLLLSLGTEALSNVLTRAVRCLAVLASNAPYHRLSSGYTSQIFSALQPLSRHRDIDVRVACLTCCGAILSVSPPLSEVSSWLSGWPWLMEWASSLLHPNSQPSPHPLLTEALQVLTAATKFYFPILRDHWEGLVELCLHHLSTPHQQHSLKLLEELTRASSEWSQSGPLWGQLLDGPLTSVLQDPSSAPQCSQACAVLATLSSTTMDQLKPSHRALALTLPLGLSRDETVPPQVSSSAVRVLGVFCTFSSLREDPAFLQDSQLAILQALDSSSQQVRIQASWALANLSEAVTAGGVELGVPALHQLLTAASRSLKDKDVVKCSAVRALGNILKSIPGLAEDEVESLSSQLAHCTSTGTMKLRWNACYACHSIFRSPYSFPTHYPTATDLLLKALCETVCTSPNYKVCTNASLALSSLSYYTPDQVEQVWSATMHSLEHSLQHQNFAEFKQAANLQLQICRCVCHVLCVQEDLTAIPSLPLTDSALSTISDSLHSMLADNRAMLEATEKKLESSEAAKANHSLTNILFVLQSLLSELPVT